MKRNITDIITGHIQRNFVSYALLTTIFIIGVSAGAFTVNALYESQKLELGSYFRGFLELFNGQDVENGVILSHSLINNMKIVLAVWFLGATVVGIPLIFVIIGIRGFITGFSVGFVINCIGIPGVLFSLVSIFLKDVLIVPCLIAMGVCGISFSREILKSRSDRKFGGENIKTSLAAYCTVSLMFAALIFIGVLAESYVSPALLKILMPAFVS